MATLQEVALLGPKTVSVPFKPCHIDKYFSWLQCTELRQSTGTEEMSLDDIKRMQVESQQPQSETIVFIILSLKKFEETCSEVDSMIGDVNGFLSEDGRICEINIMLAEESSRGKGLAFESCQLFLSVMKKMMTQIEKFTSKVRLENIPSQKLFEKLGFTFVKQNVFEELEYELLTSSPRSFQQNLSSAIIPNDNWQSFLKN